jgi:hypothetical protein
MAGEVSEDEVMFIVTRTDCPDYERYVGVVNAYHEQGNPFASNSQYYELGDYELEDVLKLAESLWYKGKIHQPRTFVRSVGYQHPFQVGDDLWWEVVPTVRSTNHAVVDAYEKYKMLAALTQ